MIQQPQKSGHCDNVGLATPLATIPVKNLEKHENTNKTIMYTYKYIYI